MTEEKAVKRWSASELESRIKSCLWSKTLNASTDEEASMGFADLRRLLEASGREVSDKTLASCLSALVDRKALRKVDVRGRPRYRLSVEPSDKEIEGSVLAADQKRLEFAGQWGVHGGLELGYTVYGVGQHSSRNFQRGIRDLCEKATGRLERLLTAEMQSIFWEIDRALASSLTRRERSELQEFLFSAFVLEMASQPSSQGVAMHVHLEKVFGPEFIPPYEEILMDFSIGHAKMHPRKTKRLTKPLETVLSSANPCQEAAGALLAFHETMALDQMERCKGELRKARVPVNRLLALGTRLTYARRALGLAVVITPKMIPQVAPAEFKKSLRAGRAERTSQSLV